MPKNHQNLLGFKVIKFLKIPGWKVLEIDAAVPLQENYWCPADSQPLEVLAVFIGQRGRQRLRFGCCPQCGYLGYIDRPTPDWLAKFYFDVWDNAAAKSGWPESGSAESSAPAAAPSAAFADFLKRFPIAQDRYVCDIGCGTGGTLKSLRQLGFSKLIGIENSRHRAALAAQVSQAKILTAPFESGSAQSELKKAAPFSLIFTRHVLEHTYYPDQVVKLANQLQSTGDFFINSLPNAAGESSLQILFFLPHLHSFTPTSFATLLSRNNYQIVDAGLTTDKEIYCMAQKVSRPVVPAPAGDGAFSRALTKFQKGLDLKNNPPSARRYLWYSKKSDGSRQLAVAPHYLKILKSFRWAKKLHYFSLSDLTTRYVSWEEAPLEIQFDGNIKLLYK